LSEPALCGKQDDTTLSLLEPLLVIRLYAIVERFDGVVASSRWLQQDQSARA
jgi:hypothetical protein